MRVSLLPQNQPEVLAHLSIDPPWVGLLFSVRQPYPSQVNSYKTVLSLKKKNRLLTLRLCFCRNCRTAARVLESTFSESRVWPPLLSLTTSLFWFSDDWVLASELIAWGSWFILYSIFFDRKQLGQAVCQLSNLWGNIRTTNFLQAGKFLISLSTF